MIDYNVELMKFKAAIGVEVGEEELFSDDLKDVTDMVEEMVEELKNGKE